MKEDKQYDKIQKLRKNLRNMLPEEIANTIIALIINDIEWNLAFHSEFE